jgi:hypothetical protein
MFFFGDAGRTFTGDVTKDVFIFFNGIDDFVQSQITTTVTNSTTGNITITQTGNNISNNFIVFGNGDGDNVQTLVQTNVANNTIGGNLTVTQTAGNISSDFIFFGNGNNDLVKTEVDTELSNVTFGGNTTITQTLGMISNDTIVFGNGTHDRVEVAADFGQDNVTGNLANNPVSGGGISNDKIIFGNGHDDGVLAPSSNNDKIILGNGANDFATLGLVLPIVLLILVAILSSPELALVTGFLSAFIRTPIHSVFHWVQTARRTPLYLVPGMAITSLLSLMLVPALFLMLVF